MQKDPNPFEDEIIAKQWISAIESPSNRSREKEFYPLLKEWSKNIPKGVIVEIGSGQGICSSFIDISNHLLIGIEPSETLVNRSLELYKSNKIDFRLGTASKIPFNDKSIEAVYSMGVWFHIEDLDESHQEISRILKKDGKLLIFTSNPEAKLSWESYFVNPKVDGKRIEGVVNVPGGKMDRNIFYVHSRKEITDSLEKYGFIIDSIVEAGFGNGERKMGSWIIIQATLK